MSLIQDALKKVQDERSKIKGLNEQEASETIINTENKIVIESKKKRYIILGISLLLLTIISVTATFLLKEPVKINKNNFLKRNMKVINKRKKNDLPNRIITKAKAIKKAKASMNKISQAQSEKKIPIVKKYTKLKENKTKKVLRKESIFPVFKQKVQLISKKRKKKKEVKLSKFEELSLEGEKLYKQKNYIGAVTYFKDALKIKKTRTLYADIYKCYKKINNLVLLKAYTIDALKYFKSDVFFNKVLGILLFRERAYQDALKYFELILNGRGKNIDVLTYKGLCLFHLRKLEESLTVFRIILELDKNRIEAYYYIGLIYDNLKKYKTAINYYKVFERLYGQNRTKNNFKHRNWVRQRISLLERSINN